MKKIVDTLNGLPLILKIILCIPALDIVWGVARICKGISDKSVLYTPYSVFLPLCRAPHLSGSST